MISDRVETLIAERKWAEVRNALEELPPPDIAKLLLSISRQERVVIFRLLPRPLAGDAFSYLGSKDKDALLKDLTDEESTQLLSSLTPDDRASFFGELPGRAIQRLINLLNPDDRKETLQLLGYPAESVGRLMTPDYVAVRPEWTVGQALEHIRLKGRDSETINMIYVTDESWKLLDTLELRRFILAEPLNTVRQIMDYTFISIPATEDREKAVQMIQHYDLNALAVVDSEGVLLGIVTFDDVMDVAQDEATEDFHKGAAITPLKISYTQTSIWSLYRRRIVWLVMLVFINLISSGVIAAYEEILVGYIALAFFIPLLIDSGGNAGSQSATLMVRAIATGDVRLHKWFWAFSREIAIGMLLGATMGLAGGTLGLLRGGYEIGIVVGLSMISIIVVANFMGVMLPFLLTKLRLDPAVASSPLITSIADAVGLLIYFGIATVILF